MKIAIMYSGGLDSRILYQYAKVKHPDADVSCVYYDHGHVATKQELHYLPDFVKVRKVDWLEGSNGYKNKGESPYGNIFIPGRNMVFAALLASQELPDEVWFGATSEENNEDGTDKNLTFVNHMSTLLNYVLKPYISNEITLVSPFQRDKMTKMDIVKWALENGLSSKDIINTWSCHNRDDSPSFTACGNCCQCIKRFMLLNHVCGESEEYREYPLNSKYASEWLPSIIIYAINGNWETNAANEIQPYFVYAVSELQKGNISNKRVATAIKMIENRF